MQAFRSVRDVFNPARRSNISTNTLGSRYVSIFIYVYMYIYRENVWEGPPPMQAFHLARLKG